MRQLRLLAYLYLLLLLPLAPLAPARAEPPAPAIKVKAVDLGDAFRNNEAAADERYTGSIVEVTGTIHRIRKSRYPSERKPGEVFYVVTLISNPKDRADLPLVFFFADRKKLVNLLPDQEVTLRGRCEGRVAWATRPGHGDNAEYSEIWLTDAAVVTGKAK